LIAASIASSDPFFQYFLIALLMEIQKITRIFGCKLKHLLSSEQALSMPEGHL
jgi:hypothetical protein